MKKVISFMLLITLFLPLAVFADGKGKPRKKKRFVRKTALVKKKVTRSVPKTTKAVPFNTADAFSYCTDESPNLTYIIYFKKVFHQAVKIGVDVTDPTKDNWVPVPQGWNGLQDQKVLLALYETVKPQSIEVYPGASSANSAMINSIVLIRDKWSAEDIQKANTILKTHVNSLGFEFRLTEWQCGISLRQQATTAFVIPESQPKP